MATIRPTLILGIGTTGLEILEDLENLWVVTFGEKIPSIFQLVVLETNRTYASPTPLGESQIRVINIGKDNITNAKNIVRGNLRRDPFWLEGVERVAGRSLEKVRNSTVGGSYHIRALGRQSLWTSWQDFSNTLNTSLGQIKSNTNPGGFIEARKFFDRYRDNVAGDPVAYVVGSSGGGTGSGIFIDIGHYLSSQFGSSGNIFGMLLLPIEDRSHLDMTQENGKVKLANTFATLQELLFYFDQRTCGDTEDKVWPSTHERFHIIPYDLVYLLGSLQLRRQFEDVEKVIAFRLFLGLFGLSDNVINGGLGGTGLDSLGSDRFVTFGLTAFYHPRREIVEASASILGVQLIENLVSSVGAEGPKTEIRQWLSDALGTWIKGLSGTENRPEDDIKKEVDRLREGKYKKIDDLVAELKPRFLSGTHGRYPGILDGNLPGISSDLKTQFGKKLIDSANQHKSLMWAKESASGISDVIDEILNYWNKIGVPENEASIPEIVERHFDALKDVGSSANPFDFSAARLGKYYEVIYERLTGLLDLIKAYKLRRTLNELKAESENRSGEITKGIQDIENVKGILIEEPDKLRSHIQSGSKMLLPVYSTDVFEGDVGKTIGNAIGITVNTYPNLGQIPNFLTSIFGAETERTWIPENIWSMLHPGSGRSTSNDIALSIKSSLISHLALTSTNKVPDVDVTNTAKQREADVLSLAGGARDGFLSLDANKQGGHTYIIKGILGKDSDNLSPIVKNPNLSNFGLQTFASDALRDFLAFCFEEGQISLSWLIDHPVWQNWYNDTKIKHDYLLNTFDLDGCTRIEKMREFVQMALHLLITYSFSNNIAIPVQSHAVSIFTVQSGKVIFSFLTPPMEVLDPVKGSDIGIIVKALAFNSNFEMTFMNNLRAFLNNPANNHNILENRLDGFWQVLGAQKVAELRKKYFGEGNNNGLLKQV